MTISNNFHLKKLRCREIVTLLNITLNHFMNSGSHQLVSNLLGPRTVPVFHFDLVRVPKRDEILNHSTLTFLICYSTYKKTKPKLTHFNFRLTVCHLKMTKGTHKDLDLSFYCKSSIPW